MELFEFWFFLVGWAMFFPVGVLLGYFYYKVKSQNSEMLELITLIREDIINMQVQLANH